VRYYEIKAQVLSTSGPGGCAPKLIRYRPHGINLKIRNRARIAVPIYEPVLWTAEERWIMDEKELKEKIQEVLEEISVWSGSQSMTLQEIATIQPSLGRIMPEIGDRTWKLYYAAQKENWVFARFQWKEISELMDLAAYTRPKYESDLETFKKEDWAPLGKAIENKDLDAFETAFHHAVSQANAYHEKQDKPYIRWQLPSMPPPDMDLTPRGE
jgi:hypothetical protein